MNIGHIENGIVLDHITAGNGMNIYNVLNLGKLDCTVALIKNADSPKMGKKDIIKISTHLDIDLDWTVSVTGEITVDVLAKRNPEFPELPRFGLRLFLPEALEDVTYYGLGPKENYIDKRQAAWHGLFRTTVSDLHEDYIRPQENGAHGDCDYAVLESGALQLTVVSTEGFSFNASHYTQEEMTSKGHNYELEECGSTVLCLDYRQNGIGSASCGPVLQKQYKLIDETIDFAIRVIPELK